ncbi:Thioredoxin domain-containing protein [[Leptolyngbya] sp. PCC 7376]|uniref:thioredoxin family protein n=1 Tax=[Leptolyngbya] sp. PCC 7376 TaxID=111781 RepID=UPI00029F4E45|nr:thioredoxin domain-containing protein [[Leptolyngbya] sp. PCC 7376]AFY37492.1 Thioredoxin domain-containing protein [[Leptolyngbya] sp. PCC 7376]
MTKAEYVKNEAELDALLSSEAVLVLDCTATWCGPCKLVAPLMDQLADEFQDRATVMKIDVDSNKFVGTRYGLSSIPAVIFFQNGEFRETLVGVKAYEEFSHTVKRYLL